LSSLKLAACGLLLVAVMLSQHLRGCRNPPPLMDQLSRNVSFSITASAYWYACNHNWSQIHWDRINNKWQTTQTCLHHPDII